MSSYMEAKYKPDHEFSIPVSSILIIVSHNIGHQSNGSNADSVAGGPSGASGPTSNAQWIEPGKQTTCMNIISYTLCCGNNVL